MKKIAFGSLVALLFFKSLVAMADAPASAADLAAQVQQAVAKKDKTALLALYCWDRAEAGLKDDVANDSAELFKLAVKSVTADHDPKDHAAPLVVRGLEYKFNLPVAGSIVIETADGPSTTQTKIPYGKKGNAYYLTVRVPVNPGAKPAPQGNSVSIMVMGGLNHRVGETNAPHFEGYYVYLSGDKEIRKELDFGTSANASEGFWANKLKHCEARSSSTNSWLQMTITENGQKVFDQKQTNAVTPLVFTGDK